VSVVLGFAPYIAFFLLMRGPDTEEVQEIVVLVSRRRFGAH
jgi:hypothetical protein